MVVGHDKDLWMPDKLVVKPLNCDVRWRTQTIPQVAFVMNPVRELARRCDVAAVMLAGRVNERLNVSLSPER